MYGKSIAAADRIDRRSAAFASAMILSKPALQRFAMRLTKNYDAAEDLVQDTLTRAWAARFQFRPDTNLRAWLFRIARNAFISGVRRSRREIAWDPDRHFNLLVQGATQDDALYTRDLRAAFARLSNPQKSVLVMIVQDGMSYADAAQVLNVSVGTVKSRIGRARASMVAYVAGDLANHHGESRAPLTQPYATATTVAEPSKVPVIDATILSRYQQWKISGINVIG